MTPIKTDSDIQNFAALLALQAAVVTLIANQPETAKMLAAIKATSAAQRESMAKVVANATAPESAAALLAAYDKALATLESQVQSRLMTTDQDSTTR